MTDLILALTVGLTIAQAGGAVGLEGAGWVGAGLLGGVLYWVFFHQIPAKDAQMAAKDSQIFKLIDSKDQQIAAQIAAGQAYNERVVKIMSDRQSKRDEEHAQELARREAEHASDLHRLMEDVKGVVATFVTYAEKSDSQIVAKLEEVKSELVNNREQRQAAGWKNQNDTKVDQK